MSNDRASSPPIVSPPRAPELLRLALPKGRMQEGIFALLADAGIHVRVGSRGYRPQVSLAGIDNLGKGAAGSAVQCLNLMCGFDERAGLTFPGLHPI